MIVTLSEYTEAHNPTKEIISRRGWLHKRFPGLIHEK